MKTRFVYGYYPILRQLHKDKAMDENQLFFSNKTPGDIIYHEELDRILGKNVHYVLTKDDDPSYLKGPVDKKFLQRKIKDFSRPFYVCGPDQMVKDLTGVFGELGARPDSVVFEK